MYVLHPLDPNSLPNFVLISSREQRFGVSGLPPYCRTRLSNTPQFFHESPARNGELASGFGGCDLNGIPLHNGKVLANLGTYSYFGCSQFVRTLTIISRLDIVFLHCYSCLPSSLNSDPTQKGGCGPERNAAVLTRIYAHFTLRDI
jgi:hypothetical protein